MSEPVVEIKGLKVHFKGDSTQRKTTIRAIDGVDFTLHKGEISALVGESGCGKTTLARVLALIYEPTAGEVRVLGQDIKDAAKNEREYYNEVQLIFQDPFASLNSLKKISHILGRAVKIHKIAKGKKGVDQKVDELLEHVNMTPTSRYRDRYPTDMSGGQRQRVAVARSLAVSPSIMLADEPTSMLDASIRLEVLNLLADLRDETGLAVLYITHDIASARYLSDRINVMYGGRIIESGPTEEIISDAVHPYTQLLIQAAPDPAHYKGSGHDASSVEETAAPVDNTVKVVGCRFANRCPMAMERCTSAPIPTYVNNGRSVECILAEQRPEFIKQETDKAVSAVSRSAERNQS